jgi:calcineurin-like phosphoesterase family protein
MKLILEKNQNLWFTSDTHYNHSNICSATTKWSDSRLTRQFNSLEEMNQKIVDNINHAVGENDILIHLGDWSFGGFEMIQEFRDRINCKNIHLVLGNHDHHIQNNKNNIRSLFKTVNEYLYLDLRIPNNKKEIDKYTIVCLHYPIASWNGMNDGVIHLHGHVHLPYELRIANGKAMDVGVDGNHLKPIGIDEILTIMKDQPIAKLALPVDHHEKRM